MTKPHLLHTRSDGTTWWNDQKIDSAVLGKGGVRVDKREGDGATPVGTFHLVTLYYRPDRVTYPKTRLPVVALTPDMGWCDAPTHPRYNQQVKLPFEASHEKMWMDAHVYDMVVSTSHNQNPIEPGKGSAIFIHLMGDNAYTEGCLAMDAEMFLKVMEKACPEDTWHIDAPE